ncbi:glycogen synthase 1 [Alphaproteobacteria bacterium]|nr:glycogen synthase 1 [Alphaproteobacteria bacterium]
MKVLYVCSEVAPYAKSGGMADVAQALPAALQKAGAEVMVVMPLYACVDREKYKLTCKFKASCVHMGAREEWFSVYYTDQPNGVPTYFVEYGNFFNRYGMYADEHFRSYGDNGWRYAFFSRAALQTAQDLGFRPDIVNVNDWMTCLIPYYLKRQGGDFFAGSKSVLTIHNLGHHGIFPAELMHYAMIDGWDFNPNAFEAYGQINLMKGGITFADKINTVSPTYARETLTPQYGCGLHDYLRRREADYVGILNGIDSSWVPLYDSLLPIRYGATDYKGAKASVKRDIQRQFGLEEKADVPLFACINRFVEQKGVAILPEAVERSLQTMSCQFLFVSNGEKSAEDAFGRSLPARFPGRIAAYIGYKEPLAHLVNAAADFYLMPSLYEPCGLNQMYAQAAGSLPIVRATGGLDDSVEQYDEIAGAGTGFKFNAFTGGALFDTMGWAVSTYYDRPRHMDAMIRQSMTKDTSWGAATVKYLSLYNQALGEDKTPRISLVAKPTAVVAEAEAEPEEQSKAA